MEEWISVVEAAKRLGLSVQAVEWLVDSGTLEADDGRRTADGVWVDAEAVEFEAEHLVDEARVAGFRVQGSGFRKSDAAVSTAAETTEGEDEDEDDGEDEECEVVGYLHDEALVSVGTAAQMLGLSKCRIYVLMQNGRLNYVDEGHGQKQILLSDVKSYARLRGVWASKDGGWTPYGKRERVQGSGFRVQENGRRRSANTWYSGARRSRSNNLAGTSRSYKLAGTLGRGAREEEDVWVRAEEEAAVLGLGVGRVTVLGRKGKLERVVSKEAPTGGWLSAVRNRAEEEAGRDKRKGRWRPQRAWFRLSSVLRLAEAREAEAWRRADRPEVRERGNLLWGWHRARIEAPPGDRLISRAEAAFLLDIAPHRISVLVSQGKLHSWQTHPGRPGCRLWLSERQVIRYRDDPERLRRRDAALRGRGDAATSWRDVEEAWPGRVDAWQEWKGLAGRAPGRERDHGEFFSTRQAAEALGVTKGTVGKLRKRGRLPGHHMKPTSGRTGVQWWFYRKDDVYDLLADRTYLDGRRRYRKTRG
jgi:hypothetical protein